MAGLDELIGKLMEARPELTREEILSQIAAKKDKIGAGYLTDQGAIFLVAGDHNVQIADQAAASLEIKDLYSGAKEVSLEARIMSMSPATQFTRKDGSASFRRTMTVYDSNATARVTLWDEKAKLGVLDGLKPGDLVRIVKAYVRSDIDGSHTLNLGDGSDVEASGSESGIPPLESIIKDVGEVGEGQKNIAVSGTLEGTINTMRFTNSRGQPGKALRMRLKGKDGRAMKVVIWGKDEEGLPSVIPQDAQVRLLGASVKSGRQEPEIHGNEATSVQVDGGSDPEPVTVRILNVTRLEKGGSMILGTDSKGALYKIKDTSDSAAAGAEGDILECMPSRVQGSSLTLDEKSYARKVDDDGSIPGPAKVRTRIGDVKAGSSYCIEAIILKVPERRDVQTKTGDSVPLAEVFVEDDTGQIWVKGWRRQASMVERCVPGEIVRVVGADARPGLEGRTELVLGAFSSITKKD